MLTIRRSTIYTLFIVALLVTEFFYISVGGGIARAYHFLAVVVILMLAGHAHQLFRSSIFLALLSFVALNFVAAFLSDMPSQAMASLMSFLANVGVAMAAALILFGCEKMPPNRLMNLVLGVTVISVFWGLIQIIAFPAGVMLALSPEQETQILIGFGPGFRTEANTFGKYMLLPFLLFLPAYLKNPRSHKLRFAYLVMIIGILMNFTRSAIFGLMAALAFVFLWYAMRGKLALVSTRAVKIFLVVALGLTLMLSGVINVSGYAVYKLENFFNKEEILEGGSSAYRLAAMEAVIDNTANDPKRLAIGNGWGQTYVQLQGIEVQAGGGDLINILGYSGALGISFYLLYTSLAFFALARAAKRRTNPEDAMFAEGLLFAFVGMFVTGQMTGYLITPEYWLLIGMCIYIGVARKPTSKSVVMA